MDKDVDCPSQMGTLVKSSGMIPKCAICRAPSAMQTEMLHLDGTLTIDCPRCGSYNISRSCFDLLQSTPLSQSEVAVASGYIRENKTLTLLEKDVPFLKSLPILPLSQKAGKLLRYISRRNPRPGDNFMVNYWVIPGLLERISGHTEKLYSDDPTFVAGCRDSLHWLSAVSAEDGQEIEYLIVKYLAGTKHHLAEGRINGTWSITPQAWEYLQQLQALDARASSAFVAMWFDEQLNCVWRQAISPGVAEAGYEPVRIDMYQHNNRIDDEIVAMIRACKFIIADFTGQRGGVYFEAGFALGLGKQVIWLCREDDLPNVHFDNRQYNFLVWSPDELDDLKNRLRNRIEATMGKGGWRASGPEK